MKYREREVVSDGIYFICWQSVAVITSKTYLREMVMSPMAVDASMSCERASFVQEQSPSYALLQEFMTPPYCGTTQ